MAVHNHVTARIDAHLPRMHLGAVVDDFTAGVRLEDTLGSASRLPLIYCDINVQQLNSGGPADQPAVAEGYAIPDYSRRPRPVWILTAAPNYSISCNGRNRIDHCENGGAGLVPWH